MKFEILKEEILKKKFGDFSQCESEWEEVSQEKAFELLKTAYDLSVEFEENPRTYLEKANAINLLKNGSLILLPFIYIREKNNMPKCPICGKSFDEFSSSVSRRDNKTEICSNCGINEAFEDLKGYRA